MILLDVNVALRLADPTHVQHATAKGALSVLRGRGETFAIVPQTVYEFWVVVTRPLAVNGLGLSVPACEVEVARLRTFTSFLPDQPSLFAEWESLVVAHQCMGKVAHDTRLVAAMRTHGLTDILTFNITDFKRYPGLNVIDPAKP
jgi:predicted nucleic acid-binding protein